jgi:DNA repair exonuclease SbcCD ATPase subunit
LLQEIENKLNTIKRDVSVLKGQKLQLQRNLKECTNRFSDIDTEISFLTASRELYQKGSTALRIRLSEKFSDLATKALRYIFQRADIKFIVELDIKSNLPSAAFFVEVDGHKLDPKEAMGGSIYEVLGLCLRLVCLEVFDLKGPLILDEPLRSVDETNLKVAVDFIIQYCRETKRQLIIVTHNELIAKSGDKNFEVVQTNGTSYIKEI